MRKNPYIDVINAIGHDFVEIGGIKWATCNVGAEKPWEAGLYFAWGDTQGYSAEDVFNGVKDFGWVSYRRANDSKKTIELEDDCVNAAWCGRWRLPTPEEFKTLLALTIPTWTRDYKGSGVSGMTFTDVINPSKEIFFPANGYCRKYDIYGRTNLGCYWTNAVDLDNSVYSQQLYFDAASCVQVNYRFGCFGLTVRGVLDY